MHERLTPLDASFLRLETPSAHMHVGWCAMLDPPPEGRPRPALEALRASIAGRLRRLPRFRQRLGFPPPGFGEPFWVDDPEFALERHVTAPTEPDEAVTLASFAELGDAVLSEPLDRSRPLWHICLVPRLEDGRVGLIGKLHHSMVDGISAVELGLLLFDTEPDAQQPPPERWTPRPEPAQAELGAEALARAASETLRLARGTARMARSPVVAGLDAAATARRALRTLREDLLTGAPRSELNLPIGPERTLIRHREPVAGLLEVKRAAGTTLNDVCLAAVAGALRELDPRRGRAPRPLKAMIPVNVSDLGRDGWSGTRGNGAGNGGGGAARFGNGISFVFVDLPIHLRSPELRLRRVHEETTAFKRGERAAGGEAIMELLGLLPDPVKDRAARLAGSARVYNLTVSNIPGPLFSVYMLGAELAEAYPVVPMSDNHALSIGMFSYRDAIHFGLYADPAALPEVRELPAALRASVRELERAFPLSVPVAS